MFHYLLDTLVFKLFDSFYETRLQGVMVVAFLIRGLDICFDE